MGMAKGDWKRWIDEHAVWLSSKSLTAKQAHMLRIGYSNGLAASACLLPNGTAVSQNGDEMDDLVARGLIEWSNQFKAQFKLTLYGQDFVMKNIDDFKTIQ